MPRKAIPMFNVPDVRATAEWYVSIGFEIGRTDEEDGELNWALLLWGESEVMLNCGGTVSAEHRRSADLYLHVEDVDEQFRRVKHRGEMVEDLHNTFYGMREFIIRDLNRFWIAFGQPVKG